MRKDIFADFVAQHEHFVSGDALYVFVGKQRRFMVVVDLSSDLTFRLDLQGVFPSRQVELEDLFLSS